MRHEQQKHGRRHGFVRSAKLEDGERWPLRKSGATNTPAEAPAETETAWDDAADTGFTTSAAGNAELDTGDNSSLSDYAAKIIYSANISAETTKFDEAVARIEAMVTDYQGFVESSNVYGNTRYNDDGTTTVVDRHASYALRIPADKFEQFMSETSSHRQRPVLEPLRRECDLDVHGL